MSRIAPTKGSPQDRLLQYLLLRAGDSRLHLSCLNVLLGHLIPFNRPHGIKVQGLSEAGVEVRLPYLRRNMNHIQGLHACALATAAEFASGLALVRHLGFSKYRLIMRELSAVYLKQGRTDTLARCECTTSWVQEHVLTPLENGAEVDVRLTPKLFSSDGSLLAEVTVHWQVKHWSAVKGRAS